MSGGRHFPRAPLRACLAGALFLAGLAGCAGSPQSSVPAGGAAGGVLPDARGKAKLPQGFADLYSFAGPPNDGATPFGGVAVDKSGNIFGTTYAGGQSSLGTIFELAPSGSSYTESVLHSYSGADGSLPGASPFLDVADNVYATATQGGAYNAGTALELSPSGDTYAETAAYSFGNGSDGSAPNGGFVQVGATLYATTASGGKYGSGAIVALSAASLQETDVYDFKNGTDGAYPLSTLAADASGALYGTTVAGGSAKAGTVFKFVPSGKGGSESVIWTFQAKSQNDGASPNSGVVLDAAGNVYGTTASGGATLSGVVYRLKPNGAHYAETLLHTFSGGSDGAQPIGGLALIGKDLYGTTSSGSGSFCLNCGTIFRIKTSGHAYSILHTFGDGDGANPLATLFATGDAVYGTTSNGGANGFGVVFRYVP